MSKDNKNEILLENVILDFIKHEQQQTTKSTIKSLNSEAHIFFRYCYSKIKHNPIILSETICPGFLKEYLDQFNNPQTIAKKFSFLRHFIKYLMDKNYIEMNFHVIHLLKNNKMPKKTPKIFTKEQLRELIQLSKGGPNGIRNQCLILILAATGLRIDELRHLKISDIDFENETFLIKWKGRTIRKIRVPLFTVQTVKNYINLAFQLTSDHLNTEKINGLYLFPSKDEKTPLSSRAINYIIRDLIEKAGTIPVQKKHSFGASSFRHTIIYQAFLDGMPLSNISLIFGIPYSQSHKYIEYIEIQNVIVE
jgi:integrase/recombinase XerD